MDMLCSNATRSSSRLLSFTEKRFEFATVTNAGANRDITTDFDRHNNKHHDDDENVENNSPASLNNYLRLGSGHNGTQLQRPAAKAENTDVTIRVIPLSKLSSENMLRRRRPKAQLVTTFDNRKL